MAPKEDPGTYQAPSVSKNVGDLQTFLSHGRQPEVECLTHFTDFDAIKSIMVSYQTQTDKSFPTVSWGAKTNQQREHSTSG